MESNIYLKQITAKYGWVSAIAASGVSWTANESGIANEGDERERIEIGEREL